MAIFVKAFMRRGSSVRAHIRTGKPGRRGANYTKRSMNKMLTGKGLKKRVRERNIQSINHLNAQVRRENEKFRANLMYLNKPTSRTTRLGLPQIKF